MDIYNAVYYKGFRVHVCFQTTGVYQKAIYVVYTGDRKDIPEFLYLSDQRAKG